MSINLMKNFSRLLANRPGKKHPIVTRKGSTHPWRRRLDVETLEGRVVPASPLVSAVLGGSAGTAIVGTVYEDTNSDGIRNNGENGVAGWTVYLDLDQSGTLNTDAVGDLEPSAVTNGDGDYVINHLRPGTYRVSEVVQSGWTPTAPVSQDVVVTNDRETSADFFNFSGGDIVGTVWNDLNEDGVRDAGDLGLANWTVFLDLNNHGVLDPGEPTTLTDADGHYSFVNLPPDDYEVTVVLPDGWDISPGFDNRQTASVVARTQVTQDYAFFSQLNGSIQGTLWNDVNADGVRNTDPDTGAFTEPGLPDWTVFLDSIENGVLDATELTAITDANGEYSFISLPERDYKVIEVLPEGWDVSPTFDTNLTVAVFAGEASTGVDFANFTVLNGSIRGTVWNDVNRNGIRDATIAGVFTEPGLAGWTVYLDLNHNFAADALEPSALTDASGGYLFTDLQVGDYDVREIVPSGWEATTGYDDNVGVTVYSGAESIAPDFANFNLATATPGSISGTVWNDRNGNGVRDGAGGVFTDPGLAGWTVFADLNSNGVLDTSEPNVVTAADGTYTISGILPGSVRIIEQLEPGWRATAPITGARTIALKNAENASGLDFGNWALQDSAIYGTVFADADKDGVRDAGERGLDGITVYLDLNTNGSLDPGEPQTTTSADLYYTPAVDEAGTYSFTHLAAGSYAVREIVPAILSATPAAQLEHIVTLTAAENRTGVNFAAVYRPTEIHGVKFDDSDGDHVRDADEHGVGGVTVFVDLDRDDVLDAGEPTTVTSADGSYSFSDLTPGAYVIREVLESGYEHSYPTTTGGILWPTGTSNPAVGNVTPTSITTSLAPGQVYSQTVSITLPGTGALTNLVDVFLLFDDTGSFVNNSPIVRTAFPTIIAQLQAALPGIDLGFGVGRFEEYANFAYEYATGRPFVLNQPIVAASTVGYLTAIQAALNRTTPGYGGDGPETDIEALYQLVTGLGFDGNNNGSVLDSGAAGLASTQLNPGASGDVPSFASFTADSANNVMAAAGTVGGGGFRAGALPIILVATDIGFAYQPHGETTVTGVGGVSLPVSALTGTSRPTTPFNAGAGFQETITGLNALGALVIGLGTNPQASIDPRQGLEALSSLTGAINRSTTTIANGTADAIAPGDPLYFQISSGFAASVANGVTTAIQNAVTNVAVDITIQASDPRVRIVNHTGVRNGIGSGQTATFDIEFIGDGVPYRFDLQFVRKGTNVVLGSIPVVLGTPIAGNGYEFEDLDEGEIPNRSVDLGSRLASTTTTAPTIVVTGGTYIYNGRAHSADVVALGADGVTQVSGSFDITYNNSTIAPIAAGTYTVVAAFTSSDPNYSNASGTATITISQADATITVNGYNGVYDGNAHGANVSAVGVNGESLNSLLDLGASFTNVPGGTANWTFAGDINYKATSGTATITISQADATITVNDYSGVYDGNAHGAAGSAIGVKGEILNSLLDLGARFTNVPGGTANWTFAGNDNYKAASGTATITISQADATITVNDYSGVYDGNAHGAAGSAIGVKGEILNSLLDLGARFTNVPGGTANWTFAGNDNYKAASSTATITISQATPTITWANPADIVFGTALSGAQLNATATMFGTFAYTPAAGTVLSAGANQSLSVSFVPDDMVNYTSATQTVVINVTGAHQTAFMDQGNLVVYGTEGADFITISSGTKRNVVVMIDGHRLSNPAGGRFDLSAGGRIIVHALGGNDTILTPGLVAADVFAGDGNDTILGSSVKDVLRGEGGNDNIIGGDGDDALIGGLGRDALLGMNGDDILVGGDVVRSYEQIHGPGGDMGRYKSMGIMALDALFSQVVDPNGFGEQDVLSGGKGRDAFLRRKTGLADFMVDFRPFASQLADRDAEKSL